MIDGLCSGWLGLGGGGQHQEVNQRERKPKIEPASALPSRCVLLRYP